MSEVYYGPNYIGNVIRIIDSRTILINVGRKDTNLSIKVGDKIEVYELGPEIKDHNGESLGNYEFIKDTLVIKQISGTYSLCQKTEKIEKTITPSALAQLTLSPLFSNTTITEYVPLKVDENDIEPLEIKDEFIRIGDPVKLA